jgi:transketolase
MTATINRTEQLCINTIRTLAMDAVQKAGNGHPGAPMGMAAMAYALWTRFLRHNPRDPRWPDRDRFVLSAGHASVLLYSLLHLTGYALSLDELKSLRQWGSKTPGHPEYAPGHGVELTTGPLGAGFGMGVGMAVAERHLAARFNRPGHTIVDHHTYAICSDGDLMEGVASEAASLAGHLRLGKIIYLYDDNKISIDGSTKLAFTEDAGMRFEAYGWHVQHVDGLDVDAVTAALDAARAETERPSLIIARTTIAYGSPNKAGTAGAHGSALGLDEVKATKEALGWPAEPAFYIPDEALAHFREAVDRGKELQQAWEARFAAYENAFPAEAVEWHRAQAGKLPAGWHANLPTFAPDKPIATRAASGKVLNAIAAAIPELLGGSADLAGSNNTYLDGYEPFEAETPAGRNFHLGVREHAMGALVNGMALHGGLIPYGGTFLVFSDYMRPALRLAALMGCPSRFIFTHDSIGLGEDGPTHQPVEHLASLRAMPGLMLMRPADANETAAAWKVILEHDGPAAIILTRQNVPVIDEVQRIREGVPRGAYVLADTASGTPDVILVATGSEVVIALEARETLARQGIEARVVSMPSWDRFLAQPQSYRDSVLPPAVRARVAVEAGVSLGWHRWVGDAGEVVAVDRFGASAPYQTLYDQFGITPAAVVESALVSIKRASGKA